MASSNNKLETNMSVVIPETDALCQYHDNLMQINYPYYTKKVELDKENHKLYISVSYNPKTTFKCPCCGKTGLKIHSKYPRIWRTLDHNDCEAYIKMDLPNVTCTDCGTNTIDIPWARRFCRLTRLFESKALALASSMSLTAASRLLNIDSRRIALIVEKHVSPARSEMDMSNTKVVGFDEKSFQKGHKYITIAVDMENKKLLFATPGKDKAAIAEFAGDLVAHNGDPSNITDVAIDMSIPFQQGIKENFHNANVTFDKFHVISNMSKVINEIRNEEVRKEPELKGTKYLFLKSAPKLKSREVIRLSQLSKRKLKTVRAYNFSLQLKEAFDSETVQDAEYYFKKLIRWAKVSRIPQLKAFGISLQKNLAGILRYSISGLTSGLVEGMNSRIQEIIRRSRGFKLTGNLINMLYLTLSDLAVPKLFSTGKPVITTTTY